MSASPYAGASADAIHHHYDVGNDFFALWLDATMTYSCALWEDGDTLERAQLRKLDHLIALAHADGAERVLDVGCGWGSLLRRLVERHGVRHATGLTLSRAQAEQLARLGDPRIEVHVRNWADHRPATPYDAVISIGAFEHFARFGLPRSERVAAYRRFFRRCRELLRPGGRLALQTNVKGANVRLDRETAAELRFVAERIFPESELPWPSEILEASAKLFEVTSVRNDADHYARTCAAWRDNLVARRDDATRLAGAATVESYRRYLDVTVGHFRRRHLGLLRIGFERV
ncbi:MAG TPA: cyclopropane-fatty-acyl-phospholipid synthase family protein [Conexibacter sp.]|nr:cyclopropane-fatty-acyl-phospholipid synthase family protein [Conexibacter sp.]